ncbi:MAG: hypothetical protein HFJ09_14005 [Lachnospiraceae bacterium]|nr:hypothetical protein [Lachnospiraceae bacterium]
MEIEKKDSFPAEDGHIESILIGVDQVKVSFQTWDSKKLVFIFDNVEKVISSHSVYGDIGEFQVISNNSELKKYIFYSAWYEENEHEKEVLSIEAEKMEIFQVGLGADINSAIFDVGYEYIGNQKCLYYE